MKDSLFYKFHDWCLSNVRDSYKLFGSQRPIDFKSTGLRKIELHLASFQRMCRLKANCLTGSLGGKGKWHLKNSAPCSFEISCFQYGLFCIWKNVYYFQTYFSMGSIPVSGSRPMEKYNRSSVLPSISIIACQYDMRFQSWDMGLRFSIA